MGQLELRRIPDAQQIVEVLELLSVCTGRIYYVYDRTTHWLRFTSNISELYPDSPLAQEVKNPSWARMVDSQDLPALQDIFSAIREGRQRRYACSYRMQGQDNEVWIDSQGSLVGDTDNPDRYIIGWLAVVGTVQASAVYKTDDLLDALGRLTAARGGGHLLLLGVDNLKTVNLRSGRQTGDRLLVDVGRTLAEESGGEVYRVGGDWFALLLPGAQSADVSRLFERIRGRLKGICTLSGGCVSCSDYHVDRMDTLLQYAETALYTAKDGGRDRLDFFTPEDYQRKLRRLELQEELQSAVGRGFGGFSLCFQPQVRAEDGTLVAAEALLRYRSARFGDVSPAEFVPLLESTGLICPVGMWVAEQALAYCRRWREILANFHVGVNMSYTQLDQDDVVDQLLQRLNASGLPGNALTIEITESLQLTNYPRLNEIFHRWKRYGIQLSVDDFGTGYSSLGRLCQMDIDELKIDRCFVSGLTGSAYNYRLLNNIIELAQSEGIRVCCEGVETNEELAALRTFGSVLVQGYLAGRPCPAEMFERCFLRPAASGTRFLPDAVTAQAQQPSQEWTLLPREEAAARAVLNAENDIIYLSDPITHEMYYMNPAGKKLFGVRDYLGKKCYQMLHGGNAPCDFCTNHLLRRDSFYVWENDNSYCGRRFLIKDKLVTFEGRDLRLEIALDITRQEYVSQSARERLSFAEKIADYTATLACCGDYSSSVEQMLAAVGSFYQADRAYLFEPSTDRPGYWCNTFEWCAVGVTTHREILQQVSPAELERWMRIFAQNQPVVILNLDPVQDLNPLEWNTLHIQDIQRLIASPLRSNGHTVGFVGVDNPRSSIHDDAQLRVLGSFLLTRMRAEQNTQHYKALLRENADALLEQLQVGQWLLCCSRSEDQGNTFLPDSVTRQILGIPDTADPVQCYLLWRAGLDDTAHGLLRDAFDQMYHTARTVRVNYLWNHPTQGRIWLRFSGVLTDDGTDSVRFRGYCAFFDGRAVHPQS